jgi:hypothetical protein
MYTVYQVVLIAEDGEYVLSEWQTENRAYDQATKESKNYGEGQRLIIRPYTRGF